MPRTLRTSLALAAALMAANTARAEVLGFSKDMAQEVRDACPADYNSKVEIRERLQSCATLIHSYVITTSQAFDKAALHISNKRDDLQLKTQAHALLLKCHNLQYKFNDELDQNEFTLERLNEFARNMDDCATLTGTYMMQTTAKYSINFDELPEMTALARGQTHCFLGFLKGNLEGTSACSVAQVGIETALMRP